TMTAHWRFTEQDVCVNWLPLYHDMGLLIQIILPLLTSARSVTMPPDYWVRQPQTLLRAIHDYQGSMTWMPNFAFHHCLRTIRDNDLSGVNLTSWRILGNGSEPVQAKALQLFAERFAPWGFSPTTLIAGYGMAENVVAAASTLPEDLPHVDHVTIATLQTERCALPGAAGEAGVQRFVSCGTAMPNIVVDVVDETGRPQPERQIGEIVVGGDSLFSGYFGDPERTAQVLRDGWFHTGDLGYLTDGELYVCDRRQDLIIVGGRNIFPESIEAIAREILAERVRHVIAFGVADVTLGTETPVLVCESRSGLAVEEQATLARALRSQISQALGIALGDVSFAERGWIVRTTSGKLARAACRDKYLAEGRKPEPPGLALLRTSGDDPSLLEQALVALFAETLGIATVAPNDNFFALGGDSLSALRMVLAVEEATGQRVPAEFFRVPTVAQLVRLISSEVAPAGVMPVDS
ncbi:MAG: hypothetical protein EOM24_27370, partial [Chloroflexia bacterium]|nr:hypothetical protein [Chloroflexia bacterium]